MMKIKYSIFAIFLMAGITSVYAQSAPKGNGTVKVTRVNGTNVLTCDLSKVSAKETVPLSTIVEDCKLIRFEDKDEALFKLWMVTVTDNYIGVRPYGSPFKLFDRSGKYLGDIGKKGNGPGEYNIAIYDEVIDEKNKRIYFAPFTGDKILVYDLSGKHIKDIKLPFSVQKPKISVSDNIITIVHMPFTHDKVFAMQIDMNGKLLKEVAPTEQMRVNTFDGELFSFRNTKNFEIQHTSLDTLYHFDNQKLTLTPVFTTNKFTEEGWIRVYREFPDRIITSAFNWKTKDNMMVSTNKKDHKSTKATLVNDYYGNLEMSFMNANKGYFAYSVEPGQLIEMIEKRLEESSCSKKDAETLNALLKTLDEDSNNLIFVGKLKQ